jgi:hypothetical protein
LHTLLLCALPKQGKGGLPLGVQYFLELLRGIFIIIDHHVDLSCLIGQRVLGLVRLRIELVPTVLIIR